MSSAAKRLVWQRKLRSKLQKGKMRQATPRSAETGLVIVSEYNFRLNLVD